MAPRPQPLAGKYQINRNTFIACRLDIVSATAEHVQLRVGIHKSGDTNVPKGTLIYLPSQVHTLNHQTEFETLSVLVHQVDEDGLHHCSAIQRQTHVDMRRAPRKAAEFPITVQEIPKTRFKVVSGSTHGLTLTYHASKLFIGLVLGNTYTLKTDYKADTLELPVKVTHIHYNWRTLNHHVGVQITTITAIQELMLNRLIDPSYEITIKAASTIDTDEARIRGD
jgi:hypothetical protein